MNLPPPTKYTPLLIGQHHPEIKDILTSSQNPKFQNSNSSLTLAGTLCFHCLCPMAALSAILKSKLNLVLIRSPAYCTLTKETKCPKSKNFPCLDLFKKIEIKGKKKG